MKITTFLALRKINKGLLLLHCGSWFQNFLFKFFSKGDSFVAMTAEEAERVLSEKHNDVKSSTLCDNKIVSQDTDLQIVIPVYNTEKFLKKCIDSVLRQKTKYSFKVVVVNDGSPDNSAEVLRQYESDDRVIVHTQENKGHSGARNLALKEIFAKYVTFVDSDDEMVQGAIERLLDAAFENDADIVQGCVDDVTLDGKTSHNYSHPYNPNAQKLVMKGFPFAKLFRSDLFKDICFPEKYWYEDSIMSMLLVPKAKRLVTIPNLVYLYTANPQSITHTHIGKPKTIDSFYITRTLLAEQERIARGVDGFEYSVEKMFAQISINWQRTFALGLEVESAIFVLTCDLFQKRFPTVPAFDPKFKSIYESLVNRDFAVYRRECAFF